MSAIVVISGHDNSKRFPGKVLYKINGKEMILHCAENAIEAVGIDNVYIATDSVKIEDCVTSYGLKTIHVDTTRCNNCSDATAEAVGGLDVDIVIDLQSDEPLITGHDIVKVIEAKRTFTDSVIVGYSYCDNIKDFGNICIKTDSTGNVVYMSRQKIPTFSETYKKQVCVYAFYKRQLTGIYGYDKVRGDIEKGEDCHILRCLDYGIKVKPIYLSGTYQSVDYPDDIQKVEHILNGI